MNLSVGGFFKFAFAYGKFYIIIALRICVGNS